MQDFALSHDLIYGEISAQLRTTLCIQFLDRENNDKNNTFPLEKQICFTIVWSCAEILPKIYIYLEIDLFSIDITWSVVLIDWRVISQDASKSYRQNEPICNLAAKKWWFCFAVV